MNPPKLLAMAAFTFVLSATISLISGTTSKKHKTDESKAQAAVKITRLDERSGGTGVVLESSTTESIILTNSHVCGVVENGGIVSNNYGRGFVTSYTRSNIHDLCLITVSANFHTGTAVASEPAKLTTTAAVSGYPRLNPNVITRGSFGDHQITSVMIGMRPCTEADLGDPTNAAICMFIGGFPIIRTYDAQFIGATIQAGNSGSAVYNEDGEIAGLVFAGSGDFGYASIVPYEYVFNFLNKELPSGKLDRYRPNTTVTLDASILGGSNKFREGCKLYNKGDKSVEFLGKLCKATQMDMIYNRD